MLVVTAAAFVNVTVLVTLAGMLLVTAAAGAPAETRTGVGVDALGLCTAGFSHFPLALGLELGTLGALLPRAGLFA